MRLDLIAIDKAWAREAAGDEGGARLQGECSNHDIVAPFLEDALDALVVIYERTPDVAPWKACLARTRDDNAIVGICSLTDRGDGTVAVGYHIFPPYQGKKLAKLLVAELIALAFQRTDMREVVTHSPPQEGPAAGVMRALDFRLTGMKNDTTNGRRWEWTLNRADLDHRQTKPMFIPMVRAGVVSSLVARTFGR
jgi:RimJ/RimL family protein N-acetyltransferase